MASGPPVLVGMASLMFCDRGFGLKGETEVPICAISPAVRGEGRKSSMGRLTSLGEDEEIPAVIDGEKSVRDETVVLQELISDTSPPVLANCRSSKSTVLAIIICGRKSDLGILFQRRVYRSLGQACVCI